MAKKYQISLLPAPGENVVAVLQGPGLDREGRAFEFPSTARALAFADAINLAYEEGMRHGMRRRTLDDDRRLVVSGSSPDDLRIRPERWYDRALRRLRR